MLFRDRVLRLHHKIACCVFVQSSNVTVSHKDAGNHGKARVLRQEVKRCSRDLYNNHISWGVLFAPFINEKIMGRGFSLFVSCYSPVAFVCYDDKQCLRFFLNISFEFIKMRICFCTTNIHEHPFLSITVTFA